MSQQEFVNLEDQIGAYVSQWGALEWIERNRTERLAIDDQDLQTFPTEWRDATVSKLEAARLYKEELKQGNIVAEGRRRGSQEYEEVPRTFWQNAVIERHDAYLPMPGTEDFLDPTTGWRDIRLLKKAVQDTWRKRALPPVPEPTLRQWFKSRQIELGGTQSKEDDDWEAAKAAFPGNAVPRVRFREIRANALPPENRKQVGNRGKV